MTVAEFDAWRAYYLRWPFDDYNRFHRPAALLSVRLGGGEIQDSLDFLQPPYLGTKTGADRDLARLAQRKK